MARGWQLRLAWLEELRLGHDPHKSSWTNKAEAARRPVDTGAALPIVFVGAGLVLGGLFLDTSSLLSENTEPGKRQDQVAEGAKSELQQIKAQVKSSTPQKEIGFRCVWTPSETTARPHRWTGITDMVANTGLARKISADQYGAQRKCFERAGRQRFVTPWPFHHRDETLGLFPKSLKLKSPGKTKKARSCRRLRSS